MTGGRFSRFPARGARGGFVLSQGLSQDKTSRLREKASATIKYGSMRVGTAALQAELERIDDRAPAGRSTVMRNELLRTVWPPQELGSGLPSLRRRRGDPEGLRTDVVDFVRRGGAAPRRFR